jgi:hypothetical protein
MNTLTGQKTNWQLVTHGDYASVANYRTRSVVVFRGIFGTLRGIAKLSVIYSTIYRTTSNSVLHIPGGETLHWRMGRHLASDRRTVVTAVWGCTNGDCSNDSIQTLLFCM